MAKGDIYVRGKNGNIIGGKVRSSVLIEATRIGSHMGTTTEVEVGTDPTVAARMSDIKTLITEKTEERTKFDQLVQLMRKKQEMGVLEPEKKALIPQFTKNMILLDADIKKLSDEYTALSEQLASNAHAKIQINSDIHAGTKVVIAGDYILIHEDLAHVKFMKQKGEIKPISF